MTARSLFNSRWRPASTVYQNKQQRTTACYCSGHTYVRVCQTKYGPSCYCRLAQNPTSTIHTSSRLLV